MNSWRSFLDSGDLGTTALLAEAAAAGTGIAAGPPSAVPAFKAAVEGAAAGFLAGVAGVAARGLALAGLLLGFGAADLGRALRPVESAFLVELRLPLGAAVRLALRTFLATRLPGTPLAV
jgi:hypothetical protein